MAKKQNNSKYDVVTISLTKDDIHKLIRAIDYRVANDEELRDEYKDDLNELEIFLRGYL